MQDRPSEKAVQPIWDIAVRIFHWTRVLVVVAAFVTADILGPTWLRWHVAVGAVMAALVTGRVIWGFTGPTYARFTSFVQKPSRIVAHLAELRAARAARHLGHNPLGGAMVLALLLVLSSLAITGALQWGGLFKAGPFAGLSYFAGADFAGLHELAANLLMALVGLHIFGVIFESRRSSENLARSMLTGNKETRAGDHTAPPKPGRPILAACLTIFLVGLVGWGAVSLTSRPVPQAPISPLAATYRAACADCHAAFHPSLMRGENWVALMAGLADHFGEDASLDPQASHALIDWLAQNSADTVDTRPAHLLAETDPAAPFTLTKTPFWRARHRAIADATFSRPPIYSRANCVACHRDADSGWFYPPNIQIPPEQTQ